MTKFCGKCGNQLEDTANVCDQCGTPVNTNATSSVQVNQTIVNSSKNNGFAVAGFVISLVSILCCGGTSILGLIFSIIGLITANKNEGNGKGLSIAGIVISAIMLVFLIAIYAFGFLAAFTDGFSESYNSSIY